MAVLQMQKIGICALKRDRPAILEFLQAAGVVEVTQEEAESGAFARADMLEERQLAEARAAQADRALEVLDEYAPEETSLFSGLAGRPPADMEKFGRMEENAGKILEDADQILALQKEIAEKRTAAARLETEAESLTPWLSLDIPLACREQGRITILLGTVPGEQSSEGIAAALAGCEPDPERVVLEIVHADADQTCIGLVCLREDAPALEEALRGIGFARPAKSIDEVPAAYVRGLKEAGKKREEEAAAAENRLRAHANSRENLKLASDYYRLCAQKDEALSQLWQSEKTFLVTGYIPARESARLGERLSARFDVFYEVSEIPEGEEAPVLLSNGHFASAAEGITASYGLPAGGEIDPTAIMSVCYVFFFGMMLSDAAYGLIIFLACFLAIRKFPDMEENLRKSLRLFMYCGVSTLVWGVLFGGWFGDVVDIVSQTWFGKRVTVPALWFIPLNDPMRLLIVSLFLGAVHLFLGLGIKGYLLLRDRKYMDFFCSVALWYLLLFSLILMLIPSSLFAPMLGVQVVFPAFVNAAARWGAVLGAAGIVIFSARDKKNPILRLALGAYDLYGVSSWLSDALSYSRLLALGLATGVIASVINQMGSMAGTGILGTLIFIVVFCFGHLFNLAINLLGAYVHTCRLQYVEFFGKFYEGGGRAFEPFKRSTKYVKIKEE